METGSIANWNLKAGDPYAPGDFFCSVETDKATVDFEAQDEGYVAKILRDAGPDELPVGAPIMIVVEDEGDVLRIHSWMSCVLGSFLELNP